MLFKAGIDIAKSKIFLFACLAFIIGIALASFLPVKFLYFTIEWFGAGIFFLSLTVLFWRYSQKAGVRPVCLFLLPIAIVFFSIWRYGLSLPENTLDKIWHYNDQTVIARGFITNEPDIRDSCQKLEIAVNAINQLPGRLISGKILATTNLYPEYKYGDQLEIECKLEKPEVFRGFAYDRYLARYNIYSVCYYPRLKVIPGSGGNYIYAKIFSFKAGLAGLIDMGLGEPESSLARPIVFGGQKGLEQKIRDDFQKVGLTHIMAVSGFNVSILAVIVMAALLALGLNRKRAFYATVIFLSVYIILVGLPASAIRAGLMGFLVLWALKLGRLNKITNSLVLTAAIMLLINPKILRDDVGFQLSFLAVAGLVYVYPILEAVWQKIKLPQLKGLSDALLITLAAQVFALPALVYNFSRISLISPLANLAVLWAVPILTIIILIALPLSAILPGLSFLFFLPSLILTKYILAVVKYAAKIPYGYMEVNYLWSGWIVVYYFMVIFIIIKLQKSKLLKQRIDNKA
ncbi:ComEC family competence protein [Patescibacteria group bacterium]|nr:ComEC family competence protein [Patescibacteria group bacterium]MBU2233420.1 ComEC family competence protein [Patescibacteria group bacterium]MBU2264304.1 ComEC family competence protein [Patescibacteria group bacterium]